MPPPAAPVGTARDHAHPCACAQPQVDGNGRLLGVLSESDLLWKGAGAPLDHTIIPPVFVGAFDLLISLRDNAQVRWLGRGRSLCPAHQPQGQRAGALVGAGARGMAWSRSLLL